MAARSVLVVGKYNTPAAKVGSNRLQGALWRLESPRESARGRVPLSVWSSSSMHTDADKKTEAVQTDNSSAFDWGDYRAYRCVDCNVGCINHVDSLEAELTRCRHDTPDLRLNDFGHGASR